jgi:hypothetical protein
VKSVATHNLPVRLSIWLWCTKSNLTSYEHQRKHLRPGTNNESRFWRQPKIFFCFRVCFSDMQAPTGSRFCVSMQSHSSWAILFLVGVLGLSVIVNASPPVLRFRSDGTFKIVMVRSHGASSDETMPFSSSQYIKWRNYFFVLFRLLWYGFSGFIDSLQICISAMTNPTTP